MLYSTQVALPIDHALPASPISVATSHVENIKKTSTGGPCCYDKSTTGLEGPL